MPAMPDQWRCSSKRSVTAFPSAVVLMVRIIGTCAPAGSGLSEMRTSASLSLPLAKVSLVGAERSPAMPLMDCPVRATALLALSRKTMRALRSLSAVISKENPALEVTTWPPLGPLVALSSCSWCSSADSLEWSCSSAANASGLANRASRIVVVSFSLDFVVLVVDWIC